MDNEQIKVKKFDKEAKIPTKAYSGDLGYDLFSIEEIEIETSKPISLTIKTGIGLQFPIHWGGFIMDRSSMAKKGFRVCGGVIDNGYTGEISVIFNYVPKTDKEIVKIEKGQKIAQIVPIHVTNFGILAVDNFEKTDRDDKGFGSSGK